MTKHGRAVVIGGSMAGVLTARALSDHFAEVTVIERDRLPNQPEIRKGVPQARHLHVFWAGGLSAVERLLPGIRDDLLAAGALPIAMPTDIAWLTPPGRWSGDFPATQDLVSASRTLLEWAVRRRVEQTAGIGFVTEHDVTGLRLDEAGGVQGVVVRSRGGDRTESVLDGDLMVDASGRGSPLPEWLACRGLQPPDESTVDAFLGYATRLYELPAGFAEDWKCLYIQAAPPRHPRGGIMFPIEDGRWVVTLVGGGQDHPPTDSDGFLAFARSLRSSALYDVLERAEPVSPIWGYRRTSNRRRYYERLATMPSRLLVVGDSLCAFNPVYGQGLAVAALQAEALGATLRSRLSRGADLAAVCRRAQRAVAKCVDGPWTLSTGSDLRYSGTEGMKATTGTYLLHRYLDRVLAAASVDPGVNAAFLRVLNLVDDPPALFRPRVMARALSPAGAAPRGPVPELATRSRVMNA
jgi:2-polyprenyl-6-methoxyphenol hydroxylase-like FAD-dependent oxidoreductase